MIMELGQPSFAVAAACMPTKINRMELSAINMSLVAIRDLVNEVVFGVDVTIITDSEVTHDLIVGNKTRRSNMDLWAQFDVLVSGFSNLDVTHSSRNVEAPQAQADAICDIVRREFDAIMSGIVSSEKFQSFEVTRKFQKEKACGS